jgi:hypothetical protein
MADDQGLPDDMGYATPNELAMKRLYARNLLEQGMTPITTPAVSPFSIGGGVLNVLAGQRMLGEAAQQERLNNAARSRATPTWSGMGGGPLSTSPPTGDQSDNGPLSQGPYSKITSAQEGSGSYGQLGPVVKSPDTGQPDRAYGKYQVMGNNIPRWTQEVLGASLSPEQFLNNPNAQEAVYKTKFGQLVQQYGPEGAARAWLAGPKGMNNPGAQAHTMAGAPVGQTVGQYGQDFTRKLASAGPGLPTGALPSGGAAPQSPATGSPQVPPAPSGGTQMAGGPLAVRAPVPGGIPAPSMAPANTGLPDPSMFPVRPRMNDQQLKALMANPAVPESAKEAAQAMYYQQHQPVQMQGAYGSNIIYNPDTKQMYVVPGAPSFQTRKVGPIEKQIPTWIRPPGYTGPEPGVQQLPTGPQSQAAPVGGAPAGPSAQPVTRSVLDAVPATLSPEDQKAMETGEPSETKTPGKESAAEAPVKLAALETGTMNDAPPPGAGAIKTPVAQEAPPGGPLSMKPPQLAQAAGPTSDISPEDNADLHYLQDLDVQKEGRVKGQEAAQKFYDTVADQGYAARQLHDQLSEMDRIVHSPDFYSGFGSGFVLAGRRALAGLGLGDKNSAAAMEAFEKMRNDLNLASLRTKLGGLGQIRLAEINMIDSAFANRDNSVAANQALVYMGKKINDRIMQAGQVANDYVAAHGGVADQTLRNRLFNYYKDTPLLTDQEVNQFQKMIETEAKPKGPLSTAPPGTVAGPSLEDLQSEKTRRQQQQK